MPLAARGTTSTARTVAFGLELAAVDPAAPDAPVAPWPVVVVPAPAPLSEMPVPALPELEVPLPELPEVPELPDVPVADEPVPDWS
jgi:hypothetical protein